MKRAASVVQVVDLMRRYPGPPEVLALHPCTFSIAAGDYVAITGPSGSGKTTLLSLLGLLETPSGGRYLLDGRDVALLSDADRAGVRATRIGFVFQAFHLIGYRTVIDNVELGLTYQGVARRKRRELAREMIARVGLDQRRDAKCSVLSGGERQRVAIARSLIREPALVLCDEPTGNLDTSTSQDVLHLIDELNANGLTVIVITHSSEVASMARTRLTMQDGVVSAPSESLRQ